MAAIELASYPPATSTLNNLSLSSSSHLSVFSSSYCPSHSWMGPLNYPIIRTYGKPVQLACQFYFSLSLSLFFLTRLTSVEIILPASLFNCDEAIEAAARMPFRFVPRSSSSRSKRRSQID